MQNLYKEAIFPAESDLNGKTRSKVKIIEKGVQEDAREQNRTAVQEKKAFKG